MAPSRMLIGGIPNLSEVSDNTAAVMGSAATGLPATNVLTPEPSEVSRVTVTDPWNTVWTMSYLSSTATPTYGIGGVFIGNHNFRNTATVRIIGRDTTQSAFTTVMHKERMLATGIADTNNITGGLTNVDEDPLTPDGSLIQPTITTSDWNARFDFNTPAYNPRTGTDMQCFVLYVKKVGSVQANGYIEVSLYEGGVYRANLGRQYVSETGGQYLIFPWDASLLSTASGANVQCYVYSSPFGLVYNVLDAVCWDSEGTNVTSVTYDSGWLSVPNLATPSFDVGTVASPLEGTLPSKGLAIVPSSPFLAKHLFVCVRAAHYVDNSYGLTEESVISYVDIGIIATGPVLELTGLSGIRPPGPSIRVLSEERGGVTEGGQTYAADAFRRRAATVELQLTRTNLNIILDRIDWRKGKSGAFWISLEPALDDAEQQFMAFWCTLKEAGDATPIDQQYSTDSSQYLYWRTMTFEEKL